MKPKQKKNGTSEPAIFCTKCGNKLLPDTVFCEQCGTRVPAPVIHEEHETVAPIDVHDIPSKKKIGKGTMILFIVLGILLVATIVAAIFIISGLGSGRSDSSDTDNSGYTSSYQDKETYDDTSTGKPSNNKKPNNNQGNTQEPVQDDTPKYTCIETGCKKGVSSSGQYCSEHKCAKSGCGYGNDGSSPYCSVHKCNDIGCDNAATGSSNYCSEHKCAKKQL